jgi:hypothetical protein
MATTRPSRRSGDDWLTPLRPEAAAAVACCRSRDVGLFDIAFFGLRKEDVESESTSDDMALCRGGMATVAVRSPWVRLWCNGIGWPFDLR